MKIKIEVDGLSLEHATEITAFLKSLSEKNQIVTSVNRPDLEVQIGSVKEEKPKQTRKKAEKVEAPKAESQEDAIEEIKTLAESIEVVEPETFNLPTLMQIRSLVAQKAGEHKDSIKAKLVELGAQNVSTLDAKHFQTIFDFLTEL